MKRLLLLFALFLPIMAVAQKKEKEDHLTKFEQVSSQTGKIMKFQDVNLPSIPVTFGPDLKASVRLIMGDNEFFFLRIEKPETSSTIARVAMIEYSDLVEINKALTTLSSAIKDDLEVKPDYLENKFITEDNFTIGYYISYNKTSITNKAHWFVKNDGGSAYFRNTEEVLKAFADAQLKIEELRAKREK